MNFLSSHLFFTKTVSHNYSNNVLLFLLTLSEIENIWTNKCFFWLERRSVNNEDKRGISFLFISFLLFSFLFSFHFIFVILLSSHDRWKDCSCMLKQHLSLRTKKSFLVSFDFLLISQTHLNNYLKHQMNPIKFLTVTITCLIHFVIKHTLEIKNIC